MAINYEPIEDITKAKGLRLVLVRGYPSPWGQAAKAMSEYKGLQSRFGALKVRQDNPKITKWSGVNSAPVMAWDNESPINRWDDILLLLERLEPQRPLVPTDPDARIKFYGLAHAMCGNLGFGWNRRLAGIHAGVTSGINAGEFGEKYGYNTRDGEQAEQRSIDFLNTLTAILKSQAELGSSFILGESVTALDFYWAAFSNLALLQSAQDCPVDESIRQRFEKISPSFSKAIDPILIEHRDRIMRQYFILPMEL
jgi:glutathione S-transferase